MQETKIMLKRLKNIKYFLFACVLLYACNDSNSVISIDCKKASTEINNKSFWKNITATIVEVECDQPLTNIKDSYVMDSLCLVLTDDGRLVCFNMKNGKKIKEVSRIGHSQKEMVSPMSISSSNGFWYVYDIGKRCVQKLDRELNYLNEIAIDGYMEHFESCKDGFVGYYIVPDGAIINFYDNNGKQLYEKKISSLKYGDHISGFNPFVKKNHNEIYVKADFSDSIYSVNKSEAILKYTIKHECSGRTKSVEELESIDNAFTLTYFIFNDYLLFSTLDNKIVSYRLFCKKDNGCSFMDKTPKSDEIPFFADRQIGNSLIYVSTKSEWMNEDTEKDDRADYKLIAISYVHK